MGRKCRICTHPMRLAIEESLLKGMSWTNILRHYAEYGEFSTASLGRHKKLHLVAKEEDHEIPGSSS